MATQQALKSHLKLLLVEDNEQDAQLMLRTISRAGYQVTHERAATADELRRALGSPTPWDMVICDFTLPGFSGAAALEIVRKHSAELPFIFLSGTIGEETAVQAIRAGAQDYILKDRSARLIPAIERELQESQRRREHQESEKRIQQLERFEGLGKLAGGIAHDFNNVLAAILGWAEMGEEMSPQDSTAHAYFQHIRENSTRAAALTQQLLAYARQQPLKKMDLNLNQLVHDVLPLLQKGLGPRVELLLELHPSLPNVHADGSQLEQVLMNLCFNARDAMPEGGRLWITTRRHASTAEVVLEVQDSGPGIPPEILRHVFEPFFTTKEVGKGTGLGLSTAMGIIKQHGGTLEAESNLGQGALFRVRLPESGSAAYQSDSGTPRGLPLGTECVLLADDDTAVRRMTETALQRLGYKVIQAQNGVEAVELFRRAPESIDVVVTDVVMPTQTGPDAYLEMVALRPDLPVVFTSGYAEDLSWDRLQPWLASGRALRLQKPYRGTELAHALRKLLDPTLKPKLIIPD